MKGQSSCEDTHEDENFKVMATEKLHRSRFYVVPISLSWWLATRCCGGDVCEGEKGKRFVELVRNKER